MRKLILIAALAACTFAMGPAFAAGSAPKFESQSWSFNGPFGHYDRGALKRGYQVYSEICAGCHSLKLVAYRNLTEIGFTEEEVKEIAAEAEIPAEPNEEGATHDDDGERLMRPAKPSDRIAKPFLNEYEARASNNGALPPDLSLMVKARKGGPDYLYALLTGYRDEPPEGFEMVNDDMAYNDVFPGHQIAMTQPLDDESVEYEDGTPMTLDQHSRDVVVFLAWAASPELEARKRLGIKVMIFLLLLTGMLYALKRRIWARVH